MDMARRIWTALFIASTAACSWLLMMIAHEAGHVLHAVISGGRVERVVLHPLVISRTDVSLNPHPQLVAWGGAVWGCALPAAAWVAARCAAPRIEPLLRFFAGFCLIANGAYLGAGVLAPVGDAADLLRLGTPRWGLALYGISGLASGLWTWHGLGRRFGLQRNEHSHLRRDALAMFGITLVICLIEVLLFRAGE